MLFSAPKIDFVLTFYLKLGIINTLKLWYIAKNLYIIVLFFTVL